MSEKKKVRWWPLWLILCIEIGVFIWFFAIKETVQGVMLMMSQIVIIALFCIWALFFSRLLIKIRLALFFGVLALVGTFIALFKIEGVDGNVVPTLVPRWVKKQYDSRIEKGEVVLATEKLTDFPQYLGPNRNATISNLKLHRNWNEKNPKLIWKRSVGKGWSSFAVRKNKAITQEQHKEEELVICYDIESGKAKWTYSNATRHYTLAGGEGPRATPTIDDKYVYALGANGDLNCLLLEDGKKVWSKNIIQENNAENATWGKSCSPLIVGNLVVVSAGGEKDRSLVAYDKITGEFKWGAGTDESSYSSPALATIEQTQQILMFNKHYITSHDPSTGTILWQFLWSKNGTPNIAQPVVKGNKVLFGSAYKIGSKLLEVTKENGSFNVKVIWKNRRMKPKFTNMVYLDGYVYGLDNGVLACIDFNTGKRMWRDRAASYGHGQVLLVDDLLLVHTEKNGYITMVEPSPKKFKELCRWKTIEGKTWNTFALAGQYLLVRNDSTAACFELPLAD